MNEQKAKMQLSFKEPPSLCELGGNAVGFTFLMETDSEGRNPPSQDTWPSKRTHGFGHLPCSDFYLSWHAQLPFNKVTTLCCHGTQSDLKPVTMTSLQG